MISDILMVFQSEYLGEDKYRLDNNITNTLNTFYNYFGFFLLLKGTLQLIIHVSTIGNALEPSSQVLVNLVYVHVKQDTCPLTTTVIKVNKSVRIIF